MALSRKAAITGTPQWLETAQIALAAYNLETITYASRDNLLSRLADDGAAVLVIDATREDWRAWITLTKTSPATRRVTVIVLADNAETRSAALKTGADDTSPANELDAILARVITQPDDAKLEEMDCQCAQLLPPEALEGIAEFNAGNYYRQHDLFEALWVAESGPVRDLYRAILQVGIAYYQITRGNHRGAMKMLLRSVQWLRILPDECQGVNVRQLREDSAIVRAALEATPPNAMASFDRMLLKNVVVKVR